MDFKPIDRFTHNFLILLRVALNIYYELFYKQLLIFYKCNTYMVWIVHHFAPFSCFVYPSHDFWMNRKWKQQSFANLIEFEISNDCQSMQWFWKWFNWMKKMWKCCWLEWMVMTTVTERAVEFKSCEHWRWWWRTPYISQWRHPSRQMY